MNQKPVSVLVIEDNRADAELVIDEFDNMTSAVAVDVICDGREALEYLRAHAAAGGADLPDIVLLDLNLPRCGGLEILEQLARDPRLRRMPVLVLTTSTSQLEINRSYELGAAAVLNKPMRLEEQREMMIAFEQFWLRHVRLPCEGL